MFFKNPFSKNYDEELIDKVLEIVVERAKVYFGIAIPKNDLLRLALAKSEKVIENLDAYCKELLQVAQQDLQAAKLLYNNSIPLYPESIYYLQQSVEKATKVLGLYLGFVNMEELYLKKRKKSWTTKILHFIKRARYDEVIGHISPRAFVLMLKKRQAKEFLEIARPTINDPYLKERIKTYPQDLKKFEKLIRHEKRLATSQQSEISEMLRIGYICETAFLQARNRKFKSDLNAYLQSVSTRIKRLPLYKDSDKKTENLLVKVERIDKMFLGFFAFSFLYPLSIITYPHYNFTRYPMNQLAPKDYDSNLGIVKSAPKIFDILEKTLKNLIQLI